MSRLNVFKYGYNTWKRPRNWLPNIRQFFRTMRYAWDRATKGYCRWDLWDLQDFHTDLIIESLEDFKKDAKGYPARLDPEFDNPSYPTGVVPDEGDEPSIGSIKWNEILDEIILHFKNFRDSEDVHPNPFEEAWFARMEELRENGVNEQGYHYTRTREEDMTEDDKVLQENWLQAEIECAKWKQDELEKGMKLMAEWYQDLWW